MGDLVSSNQPDFKVTDDIAQQSEASGGDVMNDDSTEFLQDES